MNYTWRACVGVPTRAPRFLRFRSCAGQITQQGAELPDPKRGRRLIQPAAEVRAASRDRLARSNRTRSTRQRRAMTLAADKLEHGKSVIVSDDSLAIDQE
jgi:hypothetical protein